MAITDPITGAETVADDLLGVISKFVPDKEKAAELAAQLQDKLLSAAQTSDQGQIQAMAAEIAAKGWYNKPHIAMAWIGIGASLLDVLIGFAVWLSYALGHPFPEPPKFFTDQLGTWLAGVTGIATITLAHQGYKQWMASP